MRLPLVMAAIVVLVGLLAGCARSFFSEQRVSTTVVFDGTTELPKAGWLTERGFIVKAFPVIEALGGTIDNRSRTTLLIRLNGKSIVIGRGKAFGSYDAHVDIPVGFFAGELVLGGGHFRDGQLASRFAPWVQGAERRQSLAYRQKKCADHRVGSGR